MNCSAAESKKAVKTTLSLPGEFRLGGIRHEPVAGVFLLDVAKKRSWIRFNIEVWASRAGSTISLFKKRVYPRSKRS